MRADADFMVFVAARWPSLVRESVLLGVRPEEAADAATDALSRCRRGWGRASQEEDVDQLVHQQLVDAAGRRHRTADDGRSQAAQELLVLAPPTLEELRRQESRNNRALLRRTARIAVPLVLVAAAGGYLATSLGDGPPAARPATVSIGDVAVHQEENPAPGVVWYADGQLHLAHAVLAVEGLEDMTRIGTGVVYGDDQGRVAYVEDDGSRALLGHTDPGLTVAATDESGWAAWVETSSDQREIVVREANTGNLIAKIAVGTDARVVAIDGDVIFYVDSAGAHSVVPGGSPGFRAVSPAGLVDVRSRTRVFQVDDATIDVVQGYFSSEFQLPGKGAMLAPDGNIVATRQPGTGDVALFDTRSGKPLATGLVDDDTVLAVAPGSRSTVAYIVAEHGLVPGHELQLRSCDLLTTLCRIAARIPNTGGTPVLAR